MTFHSKIKRVFGNGSNFFVVQILLKMETSTMSIDSSNSGRDEFPINSGSSFFAPNISDFGLPSELSELNLPSNGDVLKYFFFLSDREKMQNINHSYESLSPEVAKKIIAIWRKINVSMINEKSVVKKLNMLINKYHNKIKSKSRPNTYLKFLETLNSIFYIGKCQCTKTTPCCCGLIPHHLQEFMIDQHTTRKNTIPECVINIVDQQSTLPPDSLDPSYFPGSSDIEGESDVWFAKPPTRPTLLQRGPYTKRYDAFNFAMMCDRFGISDKVASCLATALFKDIGFKDENGETFVMDKSKVAREKLKSRESVRRMQYNASNLLAFSFDGRKNDALTRKEKSGKYHPELKKESHIVILKEPESKLLGHIKVDAEDASTKQIKLYEFFQEKNLSLTNLIGICCDGEPTNTGIENGIIRRFEILLEKPLHWFVCLLHFNELPFRHLFNALEMSVTSGPRTASGTLSKLIETCEELPVGTKLF